MIDAIPKANSSPPNVRTDQVFVSKSNTAASTQSFEELFNLVKDFLPVKEEKLAESDPSISKKTVVSKKRVENKEQTQFDNPDPVSANGLASSQFVSRPESSTPENQDNLETNNGGSVDSKGTASAASSISQSGSTGSSTATDASKTDSTAQDGKSAATQVTPLQTQTSTDNSAALSPTASGQNTTDQTTLTQSASGNLITPAATPATAKDLKNQATTAQSTQSDLKASAETTQSGAASANAAQTTIVPPTPGTGAAANTIDKTNQPVAVTDNSANASQSGNTASTNSQAVVSAAGTTTPNGVTAAQTSLEAAKTGTPAHGADTVQKSSTASQAPVASATNAATPADPGQVKPLFTQSNSISEPARLAEAHSTEIINQITKQIENRDLQSRSSIQMQLFPQELGRIDLRVSSSSQGLNITLNADQASTNQMLKGQIDQLRQSLSDAGIQLANLNVGQQSSQPQSQGNPAPKTPYQPINQAPVKENVTETQHRTSLTNSGQSIDYRI